MTGRHRRARPGRRRTVVVHNRTRSVCLGERIALADGFWTRLRGLLGAPEPAPGEGLLILPSRGVHMYGMRYALDVLLLDAEGEVVAAYQDLAPGTRTRVHRTARSAVELPAGSIARSGTRPGDVLSWEPSPAAVA